MLQYHRITSIQDPLFAKMHQLMGQVFPPEEVLEFKLWEEPLQDNGLRVCVAVHDGEVVGATEYRYYEQWNVAMTDFTIIGRPGLGIGKFLADQRMADLKQWAGVPVKGMFAEIYDPYQVEEHAFGGVKPMDPYVRREVLSHMGYKRLDFPYVHPSWQGDGEAVSGLDLCFLPLAEDLQELDANLIADFLKTYYAILPNKPQAWHDMVSGLERRQSVALLPL